MDNAIAQHMDEPRSAQDALAPELNGLRPFPRKRRFWDGQEPHDEAPTSEREREINSAEEALTSVPRG